jgi:hypothetical protein
VEVSVATPSETPATTAADTDVERTATTAVACTE